MTVFKKTLLAGALAATAAVSTTPAMARDSYRGNDNTAAIAIGAGVVGLALGAIIASNNDDRYDDGYARAGYSYGPAYTRGWEMRDGYYWDRDGHRHTRDEYARYQRSDRGRDDYRGNDHRGNDYRGGGYNQHRGR
ncbi:hypothetical protein HT136_00105 [Novosphingobium profundi]|uniref:hypothetical protein n=1 Tax=Novosphingobium profundi TaxID=1774954 RepID=UPI001BDAF04F|nr:hypothetical protein [Novosphingobium profundi]MBT0666771.1 hypothetical protein [Novosphingobium profundi]